MQSLHKPGCDGVNEEGDNHFNKLSRIVYSRINALGKLIFKKFLLNGNIKLEISWSKECNKYLSFKKSIYVS